MDQKALVKFCKDIGCCDACCLRYLGIKNPAAYENTQQFILKYQDQDTNEQLRVETPPEENETEETSNAATETPPEQYKNEEPGTGGTETPAKKEKTEDAGNGSSVTAREEHENEETGNRAAGDESTDTNGSTSPPPKRRKSETCVSCLGILQESSWPELFDKVKQLLEEKRYECRWLGCALSAPMAAILRERAVTLHIIDKFPQYNAESAAALKEAWRWARGGALCARSGLQPAPAPAAAAPLLLTVTALYTHDLQELEILKTISPSLFARRSKQKRRFGTEMTRRCVEQALEGATLKSILDAGWGGAVRGALSAAVRVQHVPLYLGGRYIKLSRELPQSPWLAAGRRVMESSVQEIIFQPIARLYNMAVDSGRLKFVSAGREDVDVRCLGDGRPFAIEISDPARELTPAELQLACDEIGKSGSVQVKLLVHVTKDDLAQLKKGEESKTKTYEALCVKLSHSEFDVDKEGPPRVTEADLSRINAYRNTPAESSARVLITQRTPLRVLHRRALLTRTRRLYQLSAHATDHPQLFVVRARAEAGTYLKEWCHGELRRSRPSLAAALAARADILALDVASVDLDWPVINE